MFKVNMPSSLIKSLTLLLLLTFHFVECAEEERLHTIDFFNLEETIDNDKMIVIRGFLYRSPDSQLILAAEPNLKSCCVGSHTKRNKQIVVLGDIDPSYFGGKAVALQGNLVANNGLIQLDNASVVEQDSQASTIAYAGLAILGAAGTILWLRKRK